MLQAVALLLVAVSCLHAQTPDFVDDWAGVKKVEPAMTDGGLALALREMFSEVAPGVRIWATGQTPREPMSLAGAKGIVWWRHNGIGDKRTQGIYHSSIERMAIDPKKMTAVRAMLPGGATG